MAMPNTLAYYNTAAITAVKNFYTTGPWVDIYKPNYNKNFF